MTLPNEVITPGTGLSGNRNEIATTSNVLTDALNVVLRKPGVAERRPGVDVEPYETSHPGANANGPKWGLTGTTQQFLSTDRGNIVAHKGTSLYYYSNGVSDFGWQSLPHADGFRMVPTAMCTRVGIDDGTLYFAQDYAIWALNQTTGRVALLAGLPGTPGSANGTGTAARFVDIKGMCFAPGGAILYVCDTNNNLVRQVTLGGVVTLLAGSGATGSADGTGALAEFAGPYGIVAVSASSLYVCDRDNDTVRNVTTGGVVTSPYGSGGADDGVGPLAKFSEPLGICFDETNCFVVDNNGSRIRKIVVSTTTVSTPLSGLTDVTNLAVKDGLLVYVNEIDTTSWTTDGLNPPQTISPTIFNQIDIGAPKTVACDNGGRANSVRGNWYVGYTQGAAVLESLGGFDFDEGPASVNIISLADSELAHARASPVVTACVVAPESQIVFTAGVPVINYNAGAPDDGGFGSRLRSADVSLSTFVTARNGIRKIDSDLAATLLVRSAGVPRALGPTLSLSSAGSPVLLAANEYRAYRVIWGRKDANDILQYGAPSERAIIQNTAGATRDVSLAIPVPIDVIVGDFYQVYATAIGTEDPGDECAIVREGFPTSSQIRSGTLTFVDIAPDVLRGEDLYTNRTQEGIGNANERPPMARDICEFRGHALYANFTDKHRMVLQMIGVGTLSAGTSKVTINGVQYNCEAAESAAVGNFQLYTSGTAAQNIENTARSLCRVINGYQANINVFAWYESAYDGAPGTILLEERVVGGDAFTVTCNSAATGNAFSPPLPPGDGAPPSLSSIADRGSSRVRVSKQGEPEACPLYRDLYVGSEDDEILRIMPLRDSVIVIKQRSIWRIVGSVFEDFIAVRLDATKRCACRDSAATLNNSVIFLSTEGFVRVTENDVVSLSEADRARHLIIARLTAEMPTLCTATSLEQQRVYLCAVREVEVSQQSPYVTSGRLIMCWNEDAQSWSRWSFEGDELGRGGANMFALGSHEDKLYVGPFGNGIDPIAFQRDATQVAVTEYADLTVKMSWTWGSLVEGKQRISSLAFGTAADYSVMNPNKPIVWGAVATISSNWYVISRDADGYYLTSGTGLTAVIGTPGVASGDVTCYTPIPVLVGVETNIGNPGELKQFTECVAYVAEAQMHDLHVETVGAQDFKLSPAAFAYASSGYATSLSYPVPSAGQNEFSIAEAGNAQTDPVTSTDASGKFYNMRGLRFFVQKEKQTGEWLGLRFYQSTALCPFEFKGVAIGIRTLGTNRVRQ